MIEVVCKEVIKKMPLSVKPKTDRKKVKSPKKSSARSLLKYVGSWAGDDIEQCLEELYRLRGEAKF